MKLAVPTALRHAVTAEVRAFYEPVWFDGFDDAVKVAAGVEAMWLSPADISFRQGSELISRARMLKWLHVSRVGIDIFPLDEMARRGIVLSNGAGLTSQAIAEHVVMCMFALRRGLPALLAAQRLATWNPATARGNRIDGSVALVLGYGHVGRAVSDRLYSLGVRVTSARRRSGDEEGILSGEEWRDQLPALDLLVLALPLTASTRNLVGEAELSQLKPGAIVINVARGEILDEAYLAESIREGRLGGAALDCFREEPLPASSPLWSLPNTIITPHISWFDDGFAPRELRLFGDNAMCFAQGRTMQNVVDLESGY
jgi:phosphoglycerate dehydrogenase-like enzyme